MADGDTTEGEPPACDEFYDAEEDMPLANLMEDTMAGAASSDGKNQTDLMDEEEFDDIKILDEADENPFGFVWSTTINNKKQIHYVR